MKYPTGVENHGGKLRIWFVYKGVRVRENLGVPDTAKKGVYLRREWLTKDEIEYLLSADTSSYLIDKRDLYSYVRPQPATMINMPQSAINAPVQS